MMSDQIWQQKVTDVSNSEKEPKINKNNFYSQSMVFEVKLIYK